MVIAAVACDSSTTDPHPVPLAPVSAETEELADHLTPEVSAQLTPNGRFSLDGQPSETSSISQSEAAEQAVAYAKTFGPYIRTYLERQRGGDIDFAGLTAGSRVYHAESMRRPASGPLPLQRRFGSYYLVHLYDAGVPVLSAAVSALNIDVTTTSEGFFRLPAVNGEVSSEVVDRHLRLGPGWRA